MGLSVGSAFQAADLARVGAATMVPDAGRAIVRGSPSHAGPQLQVWGVRSEFSVELVLQIYDSHVEICLSKSSVLER